MIREILGGGSILLVWSYTNTWNINLNLQKKKKKSFHVCSRHVWLLHLRRRGLKSSSLNWKKNFPQHISTLSSWFAINRFTFRIRCLITHSVMKLFPELDYCAAILMRKKRWFISYEVVNCVNAASFIITGLCFVLLPCKVSLHVERGQRHGGGMAWSPLCEISSIGALACGFRQMKANQNCAWQTTADPKKGFELAHKDPRKSAWH